MKKNEMKKNVTVSNNNTNYKGENKMKNKKGVVKMDNNTGVKLNKLVELPKYGNGVYVVINELTNGDTYLVYGSPIASFTIRGKGDFADVMSANKEHILKGINEMLVPKPAVKKEKTTEPVHAEVWTDGGSRMRNNKIDENTKAAWSALLVLGKHEKLIGEACKGRTNNFMELTAIAEALKAFKKRDNVTVTIYSDSKYCIDSITKWMGNWKSNGWTKKGGEIKNLELFKEIDSLMSQFLEVEFVHVKGHNGEAGNERVDAHLNELMDKLV